MLTKFDQFSPQVNRASPVELETGDCSPPRRRFAFDQQEIFTPLELISPELSARMKQRYQLV